MTSLLTTLRTDLEDYGYVVGSLLETRTALGAWIRDKRSAFGFKTITVERGEVMLYLGLVTVTSEEIYGKETTDVYLSHKLLCGNDICYFRVGADNSLREMIRVFKLVNE